MVEIGLDKRTRLVLVLIVVLMAAFKGLVLGGGLAETNKPEPQQDIVLSSRSGMPTPPMVEITVTEQPVQKPVVDPKQAAPKPVEKQPEPLNGVVKTIMTLNPNISEAKASEYNRLATESAAAHGIEPTWVIAMMFQESRFNENARSSAGAVGLMQLLPSTAQAMGAQGNLSNPSVNVPTGVKYLGYLKNMFGGDIRLATIAYNQGEGNVIKGTYRSWYYDDVQKKHSTITQMARQNR